jgi:hypothetical protein
MVNYYQSMECDRRRGLIFSAPPSAECSAARDRIQVMEDNYNNLLRQASTASEERRRSLLAAIERSCVAERRPRGFLDGLFGREEPYVDPRTEEEVRADRGLGSGKPICVRTCDGFFFPLATSGGGRASAEQMCQAQCPAAQTQLFFLPGDSELQRAVSADGVPYTSMPNAFRYRTTFDPDCSCRLEGQSWAEALQQAEQMLSGRGDVVLDIEAARQLSLPREMRGAPPASAPAAPRSDMVNALPQGPAPTPLTGAVPREPVRIIGPDLVAPPNRM